jgi:hypothetical protein
MCEEEWQPAAFSWPSDAGGCKNRVGIFAEVEVEEGLVCLDGI